MLLAAALLAASLVMLAGCGSLTSTDDETVGWSAQRLYGEAKDSMSARDWAKAIKYLEKLQAVGFDLNQVRIQQGVHNKGIVRDGTAVLISSQNWSADGVLRNRDAGVIIENADIAQYFQQIFMHDWTHLARQQALDA